MITERFTGEEILEELKRRKRGRDLLFLGIRKRLSDFFAIGQSFP